MRRAGSSPPERDAGHCIQLTAPEQLSNRLLCGSTTRSNRKSEPALRGIRWLMRFNDKYKAYAQA